MCWPTPLTVPLLGGGVTGGTVELSEATAPLQALLLLLASRPRLRLALRLVRVTPRRCCRRGSPLLVP